MLKYFDSAITLQEVPDEISLAINITNCPHRCAECHSPYLRDDIGTYLSNEEIKKIIDNNSDITCICIMGGDSDHLDLKRILSEIKKYNIKTCLYSGNDSVDNNLISCLDYYKVGHYDKELGPLNRETTNQIFYKIDDNKLTDITYRFWPHKN